MRFHRIKSHYPKVILHKCKTNGAGRMDWDDLRIFLAVARSESLSGAGKRMGMDPATVGRRIARLEDAAALRLFSKSPQGYALTEAGQRLIGPAEAAEAASVEAEDMLRQAKERSGLSGQIRLGAPDGCANFLLPKVVADICRANPDLELQVVALPRVFNLSKREADMAIGVSQPQAGRMVVQRLSDYHLCLAAHQDYLGKRGAPADLAALHQHRMIGYIPDMIYDGELDYHKSLGLPPMVASSNAATVQFNMLRTGLGIGVVHEFALPAAPELRRILVGAFRLKRAFWLMRHEGDQRSDRLNRFARALQAGLRGEIQRLEAEACLRQTLDG